MIAAMKPFDDRTDLRPLACTASGLIQEPALRVARDQIAKGRSHALDRNAQQCRRFTGLRAGPARTPARAV